MILHGFPVGTSGYVNIDFYNGISYSSIATGVSASLGTYNWFVPAISSGTYQIYIEDAANSNINNTSASFIIPFITVVRPTNTSIWAPSSIHNITWTASGFSDPVNIEYYNGISYILIVTGVPVNNGTYRWTIPPLIMVATRSLL